MTQPSLTMFTVYDHPRDFPRHFVVRMFIIAPMQPEPRVAFTGCLYDTLAEAREDCQRNGADVCLERDPGDDLTIIETWMR